MTGDGNSTHVRLEIADSEDVEEVVLAFRIDGELHELAGVSPPVEATITER